MSDDSARVGDPTPRPAQRAIIESSSYPLRVLAGAGTGKTFTMVRTIERLIDDGVSPDRVLALTFTNKAADSMREKLVDNVGERGYDVDAYTYHAICHEILQEYAYHADLDPRYDIASDADRFALVYEVLDEMPYRFTKPEAFEPSGWGSGAAQRLLEFIPAMKREGIRPDEIDRYLAPPKRLIELDAVVDRIEEIADEHVRVGWRKPTRERLANMRDGLSDLRTAIQGERDHLDSAGVEGDVRAYLDGMIETCESLTAMLTDHEDDIVDGELQSAYKLPGYLFGAYAGPPSGIPDVGFTLTDELRSFITRCQTASDLTVGYAAYERRLRERNLLDFDDLVLETVALLDDPEIREWVAGQWDYVFCDEFQDTDTIQFDLVEKLVTDDRLFVVGDDDQAIYEWRGANVDNIGPRLDAAYPDVVDKTLEENFRSRQPILDLANNAIGELDRRDSTKTLTAVGEQRDATDGVVTIDAAEEPEDEADQIVNAIARLITGETDLIDDAYDPGDVAVLVRTNAHARPIIRALDAVGIPYELAGDLATESVGVETVLAYLKALADPTDEVSLNRVLTLRYRLRDADLRYLNTREQSLMEALVSEPLDAFVEPERVAEARDDIEYLLGVRDTHSLSRLYRELKERTNIEWFLSEQERRNLTHLDELISSFGDDAVQPELDREFVEFLRLHGTITQEAGGSQEDQPEPAESAVTVMTVHKSKGLEFPVVFLPRLTADQWQPGERLYDELVHVLDDGGSPLDVDFAKRDERETRRVFHVGITRAEDLAVLVGRTDDDGDDEEDRSVAFVEGVLSDRLPWEVGGVEFPVWETVRSSRPSTTIDGTETLANPIALDGTGRIRHRGESLDRGTARERVLSLARSMLDGGLTAVDPETLGVSVEALGDIEDPSLLRRHSYTSLDTLDTCTRRHYLDYVVRAFDDPVRDENRDGPSAREVGILFHETAERAANRGYSTRDEWIEAARRIAHTQGLEHALSATEECIDRYFETEASDWTLLSAERSFDLDIDGHVVTGKIDALCRTQDGTPVVLDYKATSRRRSLESDLQLPVYLLACEEVFDEPVRTAGYAYVGTVGPDVELRTFSVDELETVRSELIDRLSTAEESSFMEYTAGEHCRWCPHRGLPCSREAGLD